MKNRLTAQDDPGGPSADYFAARLIQQRAWHKAYRERNKKKISEYAKKYKERNREKLSGCAEKYRAANAAKMKAYKKEYGPKWYRKNKLKYRAYEYNRKALQYGSNGRFSESDLIIIRTAQENLCFYCLEPLGASAEIDHKTPFCQGGSNDPSNLAWSCKPCNRAKGKKNEIQFRIYMKERVGIMQQIQKDRAVAHV